jgi:hypothetical protein
LHYSQLINALSLVQNVMATKLVLRPVFIAFRESDQHLITGHQALAVPGPILILVAKRVDATPENPRPWIFAAHGSPGPAAPQHCLYLRPDPQAHGSLRPTFGASRRAVPASRERLAAARRSAENRW